MTTPSRLNYMPRYSLEMNPLGGISLRWPNKCVVCGQPATTHGEAYCTVLTDVAYRLIYWNYSTQSMSIRYPLCREHRLLRYVPSLLSRRHFLTLCVAAILLWFFIYEAAMPVWAWALRGDVIRDPTLVLISTAMLIAGIAAFGLAKHFTPVKINDIGHSRLVISISNPQYASEFEAANADHITAKDGYSLRIA